MALHKTERAILEEEFLSRIKIQNRFYRKGSNRDLFPIWLITSVVNRGKEVAEMDQFIRHTVIGNVIVHFKTEEGVCTTCKWREVKRLEYSKDDKTVAVSTEYGNGILMEPPISNYTVDFIRHLSPELSAISFAQEKMILEPPKKQKRRKRAKNGRNRSAQKQPMAIFQISLDHIIPINLFLHEKIASILFPKLHELNSIIKRLPGFEKVENQKQFYQFIKEQMADERINAEISAKCREVFEEFKNPDSKSLEYLFAMQLMSRGANSAKNDDTI